MYVDSVTSIMGLGSGTGQLNRFAGVVEPQKTVTIKQSSDKKVKECYVKEGDEVKKGQKLFIYDTSEAEENLSSKEIEIDRIKMDIETYKSNIATLQKEKANASSEDQLDYTVRIQSAQNNQKKSEYELKSTQQEIEQLKKSIQEAEVTSEIDGVVKSINNSSDDSAGYSGSSSDDSNAYMTLLSTGHYRIKGTINEQNRTSLNEGDAVIVHSRVDENQTWKGTVSTIDLEHPEENSDSGYYMSSSSSSDTTSSSNYPFYIDLEDDSDLMLGQHVYVEKDEGQTENREGLWLTSYYIIQEDGQDPYVWAAGRHDKIEKRKVTLGEYDEKLDQYQITDGLTEDDYIAYPEDSITEGEKVTKNIEDIYGNSDDGSDGSMDGGVDSDVMNGSDDGEIIGGSDEDVMPKEAGSASDMINSADDICRMKKIIRTTVQMTVQAACRTGQQKPEIVLQVQNNAALEEKTVILELKHIYKDYIQGSMVVPVLKDINLQVEKGEYLAIMGPSGSGKSTLMNIVGCLDRATKGEFILDGHMVGGMKDNDLADLRLNTIGFVFQTFQLLPRQTALDNVALPLIYAGVPKAERMKRAAAALDKVGLSDRMNFIPNQLSGGQKQRVAIARAIVNNPEILLADEPTGALDSKSSHQVMELFQKLNDEGVTVVMITHDSHVAQCAKRIVDIFDGEISERDRKEETL